MTTPEETPKTNPFTAADEVAEEAFYNEWVSAPNWSRQERVGGREGPSRQGAPSPGRRVGHQGADRDESASRATRRRRRCSWRTCNAINAALRKILNTRATIQKAETELADGGRSPLENAIGRISAGPALILRPDQMFYDGPDAAHAARRRRREGRPGALELL